MINVNNHSEGNHDIRQTDWRHGPEDLCETLHSVRVPLSLLPSHHLGGHGGRAAGPGHRGGTRPVLVSLSHPGCSLPSGQLFIFTISLTFGLPHSLTADDESSASQSVCWWWPGIAALCVWSRLERRRRGITTQVGGSSLTRLTACHWTNCCEYIGCCWRQENEIQRQDVFMSRLSIYKQHWILDTQILQILLQIFFFNKVF